MENSQRWGNRKAKAMRAPCWGQRFLDHAEPLIGVEEGVGPVRMPTCLAMARGIMRNRISAPGPASARAAFRHHHGARALGQHLARAGLAPVPAVGRDRERLGPDHLAPDAAREAEAVAADAAQAGLIVVGRAEPGPRAAMTGPDRIGASSQHRPAHERGRRPSAGHSAGPHPGRGCAGSPGSWRHWRTSRCRSRCACRSPRGW
jgi:hypothetical protein